jgi:NADP-dependent 3-hydroxy acid dehydrogenase YdfG
MLVRDQFEKNFFGPMNIIKAAIPQMRSQMNGHVIAQTSTTGK